MIFKPLAQLNVIIITLQAEVYSSAAYLETTLAAFDGDRHLTTANFRPLGFW